MTDLADPAVLAARLVDELVAAGCITSSEVAAAFRAVPRHVFAPEARLAAAYSAHDALVTKRDARGNPLSSVSSASVQATMLEQARIEPGMRVLEIGSGGCNAALLAHLVGAEGAVTSIDIDAEIVERAQRFLAAVGVTGVRVALGDAEQGWPADAPYDRVVVTVRAWDVPPAWTAQLVDGGLLVVPLEIRGQTRSVALRRTGSILTAESAVVCGFVPMQGAGAHAEQFVSLRDGEIVLRAADAPLPDAADVEALLTTPRVELWTGVRAGRRDRFDALPMWLATVLDGYATIAVDPKRDSGVVSVASRLGTSAAVEQGALAYVTIRAAGDDMVEIGVQAFGSAGAELAATMAAHVRTWSRRRRSAPTISVHPVGAPVPPPKRGRLVRKQHTVVRVEWP